MPRQVSLLVQRINTKQQDGPPDLLVYGVLLIVTFIWGSGFLIIHHAVSQIGPFLFMVIRFAIAVPFLLIIFRKKLVGLTKHESKGGAAAGFFLFSTICLITAALQFTVSSKAAFITSLYVVFVPIIAIPLLKQIPSPRTVFAVILAVIGLAFLTIDEGFSFTIGIGEGMLIAAALTGACHILVLSRFAAHSDPINLAVTQIVAAAILSFLAFPFSGEKLMLPSLPVWGAALYMGTVMSTIPFIGMSWVQKHIDSTQAALFYALEPVWAAVVGFAAGERLTPIAVVGCVLIFAGTQLGDLKPRINRFRERLRLNQQTRISSAAK